MSRPHRLRLAALALGALSLGAPPLAAQCTADWLGDGWYGLDGPATSSALWDPDGSGPLGPRLVVAGSFTRAGDINAPGLAAFEFATQQWSTLGNTTNVAALATSPPGALYAVSGTSVLSWAGNSWQSLGTGMNGGVNAIVTLPNGDVLAAGAFTVAGSTPVNGFARWDGSTWQSTGLAVQAVGRVLTVLANGDVLAAGTFHVGGVPAEHIARWNGAMWTVLGSALGGTVNALAESSTGELIAGGPFGSGLLRDILVRWDGSAWVPYLTHFLYGTVSALAPLSNGAMLVGGILPSGFLARYDGTNYQQIDGGADAPVRTLCRLAGDDFVAGGDFIYAGSRLTKHLALHSAAGWQALPTPTPAPTMAEASSATLVLRDGTLVAAGRIIPNEGNEVARWNGSDWQVLAGINGGAVNVLVESPNGDIWVGGSFGSIVWPFGTYQSAPYLARWRSGTWQWLGQHLMSPVTSAIALGDDVVVGTAAGVSRWSNGTWQALGSLTYVIAVAALSDGGLYASTVYLPWVPIGTVWRWSGSTWQSIGSMNGPVRAMAEGPSGQLVAAGSFALVNGQPLLDVATWNGAAWQPIGPGNAGFPPAGIDVMSGNPLVVGGSFQSSPNGSAARLAKWDGAAWTPISAPNGDVSSLTVGANGLFVGGSFSAVQGKPATNFAEYRTTCPGTASGTGLGCAGTGGLLQTTLLAPWLGGAYRSRTTGFSSSSIAFALWGFSNPDLDLSVLHPLGGQGCRIYANNDVVLMLLPFAGEASTQLTVPNLGALAGVVLHHQLVEFEFDASGAPTGVHSGNGLRLQIGSL